MTPPLTSVIVHAYFPLVLFDDTSLRLSTQNILNSPPLPSITTIATSNMAPALPHSPGASTNLASLAQPKEARSSGSSLASSLVAGKHPFADAARHRLEPVSVPPRGSSLAADTAQAGNVNAPAETTRSGEGGRSAGNVSSSDPSVSRSSQIAVSSSSALEQQRLGLVGEIANEARANKAEPLDEAGQRIFRDAGFENRIDAKGSVDVDTRWLKPVIQVSTVILQR